MKIDSTKKTEDKKVLFKENDDKQSSNSSSYSNERSKSSPSLKMLKFSSTPLSSSGIKLKEAKVSPLKRGLTNKQGR
jgi:hypothetical protein